MQVKTVIVVAAGEGPAVGPFLPREATVIAADGGLDRARELGLEVTLAVGDFDSATAAAIDLAERDGVHLVRHPPDKDATDLELALEEALAMQAQRVVVVGSGGGRLDHLLASALVLASPRFASVEVDAWLGEALVHVIRSTRTLRGEPGELLTLLAVNGGAEGVSTTGLEYPLDAGTLEPSSSRGVSNVFASADVVIRVASGVLIAVRPYPSATATERGTL